MNDAYANGDMSDFTKRLTKVRGKMKKGPGKKAGSFSRLAKAMRGKKAGSKFFDIDSEDRYGR